VAVRAGFDCLFASWFFFPLWWALVYNGLLFLWWALVSMVGSCFCGGLWFL